MWNYYRKWKRNILLLLFIFLFFDKHFAKRNILRNQNTLEKQNMLRNRNIHSSNYLLQIIKTKSFSFLTYYFLFVDKHFGKKKHIEKGQWITHEPTIALITIYQFCKVLLREVLHTIDWKLCGEGGFPPHSGHPRVRLRSTLPWDTF